MSVHLKALELRSFLSIESSRIMRNLAQAYGFNLSDFDTDIFLKLQREYYDDLILERKEGNILSLTYSFSQKSHLMYDPRITFLIDTVSDSEGLLIYPLTFISSVEDIRKECATLTLDCSSLKSINTKSMEKIADISNTWLGKIKDQSWFLPLARPNPDIKVTKA